MPPSVSIIVPVYNEEDGLSALFARLYPALDALGDTYEVIFINDGSRDRSAALLRTQFEVRPDVTRVVLFNGNFGQHMAIMAGFEQSRGEIIVTLDADLQNPPEEISKLVAKAREGYDYVGTIRHQRQDSWFRRTASKAMNALREKITRIKMTDQGCMLRAYSRETRYAGTTTPGASAGWCRHSRSLRALSPRACLFLPAGFVDRRQG